MCGRRNAPYWPALFKRATKGPMTAAEVGAIMDSYGPDAITRLRRIKSVGVEIVGEVLRPDGKGKPKNLYAITDTFQEKE